MLTALAARVLGPVNAEDIARILRADPFAGCIPGSRFTPSLSPATMGGEFWGVGGGRNGLIFAGPNLIPVAGDTRALRAIAAMALRRGRRCASLMGRSELVVPLWEMLEPKWGPARAIRWHQPLLTCEQPSQIAADPLVRMAHPEDIDLYFPAAVAMFTAEIGTDPRTGDGGRSYRARLLELMSAGRCFVRIEGGQVVFKAEIGALTDQAALIQGVWVHESHRGQGLGTVGMAAVVQAIREGMGRTPCLYVNDFNTAARRAYARVGFCEVAAFTSVLF